MDIRLREIAGKAAGTYFIVTDNSAVTEIEETSKLRLFFINSEKGPVNTIVVFKKGDSAGLQSIFGKRLRKKEKQGNFSIKSCLDALTAGPIAVMNLRVFTDVDKTQVAGISPNKTVQELLKTNYTNLFNTNSLWTIKPKNITNQLTEENLLTIGNVGTNDSSYFIVVSKKSNVDKLTSEGDNTLQSTILDIDDYPALSGDMLLQDTFVDVYVFNNTFDPTTVSTNRYFGHLFGQTGLIDYTKLDELAAIPEAGYNRRLTGSLIPNLKNEFGESISIDSVMNSIFPETGLIAYLNDDILEFDNIDGNPVINTLFADYYDVAGALKDSGILLSHRLQPITKDTKNLTTVVPATIESVLTKDIVSFDGDIYVDSTQKNRIYGILENGIRVGARIDDENGQTFSVLSIQIVEENSVVGVDIVANPTLKYTRVVYTLSGALSGAKYLFVKDLLRTGKVLCTNLESYKPRETQFTNGTNSRQNEILDMMLSPGIIKGLKNFGNIRYVVDTFKSFIDGGYKSQFGQLVKSLDDSNKFVRALINEPFIEDLEKSTNPLFKQSPTGVFDMEYLLTGGNQNYSTNFLTKFATGAEMCFFYGSILDGTEEVISVPQISNLFIQKTFAWDVIANASGYLDSVDSLALNPDDDERKYMEKFKWNPIIKLPKGFAIYGNTTGQKANTALSQIHNSELLAYIKESLYNLSRDEAFKKGTYNEYLATETEVKSFMDSLALSGAIQANPIVICNASNNTTEISKQKIKLIHVEYYNIDALDKVVFDLNLK